MAKSHPRWRLAKKVLTWLFFIAVVVLLVVYAKKVDWGDVWTVIRDYNRTALLSAVGLVIVSYLLYGCYDLLGRLYCGHKLAKRQVMLVSFVCYAFNLTLSTWVGGIGMRYRLPAGIGVLEAVFLALLAGEHTSQGTIIAALLAYRVLYYFIPLLLALVCYLILESRAKKLRAKNERAMAK
ncbi:UPF0104 family protein [Salmonella enterica subsp. enterica]|nr:UPF0104 family protein [Salmonella enterica subsp. enterica serovar Brunei]ECJ4030408.1 UPF0104 family protein [Salmonella enterica subsp. enterica]ECG3041614.1 UPF0104 family protein [Salmonella enterica subsp. enterica serovar Brunei]ECZ3662472.1 UPF0104 family protein [Salmonella enterica subsp. enterica serovar Brunei]EDT7288659.1 UPF0104 family protein [Salmonella enterica subsp. enterica]